MTSLSTHVLDTAHGRPAAGVKLRLTGPSGLSFDGVTDDDGRCRALPALVPGRSALHFEIAAYFSAQGLNLAEPPFIDFVTIDFGVSDDGHYHIPLLVSPFAYSTYRGS